MSTFKLKLPKTRYASNIHTLDELHRNNIDTFTDKKNKLGEKRKILENLTNELEILDNKKFDESYHIEDTRNKCRIKNEIRRVKDEINDIETDTSEIEYYSKTADILIDYYDKINVTSDAVYLNNNEMDNINKNITKSDTALDKLNKIQISNRKHKNVPKNRKKNNNVVHRDIQSFFTINSNKNTNNVSANTDQPKTTSRAECLENYKFIMGYESNNKQAANNITKMCGTCNIEKIIFVSEGTFVCEKCGEIEPILLKNEKPSYKENTPDKPGYPYKKINHFTEWLTQFQGKESTDVPKEIYDLIYNELYKNKMYDFKKITISYMRYILKNLSLTGYYEHAIYILSKISRTQAPIINRETEEKLKNMFKLIQAPFEKHRPKARVNFLSYSYVLHKFCQLLELDKFVRYFPLLKSREKLRSQDKIWEAICKELRWEFISSI